jgi:hypothetical protein
MCDGPGTNYVSLLAHMIVAQCKRQLSPPTKKRKSRSLTYNLAAC